MFVLSIIASTLLVSQVTALAAPAIGLGLFARQVIPTILTDSISPACQSACTDLENISNNCAGSTDLSCFCSDSTGQPFAKCANCAVSQPGVTSDIRNNVQEALASMTITCQHAGHPFSSPLTLSGASSSSSSSGSPGLPGSSSSSGSSSSGSSSSSSSKPNGALSISPRSAFAVFAAVAAAGVAAVI